MSSDPSARRAAIGAAFGAAADRYETHAAVQREVAERLADRIAALPLPARPRILEIGCGTGFLNRALRPRLRAVDWVLTDLSPAMLAQCRNALGASPDTRFLAMDGEQPCVMPAGGFDLICSSLAFQWFQHPGSSLACWRDLLAPGGHIAYATMAVGSFREWRETLTEAGLDTGIAEYPDAAALMSLWPGGGSGRIEQERRSRHYPDAESFLSDLKAIGAGVPVEGHRPIPAGRLRRVLRRFAPPVGLTATYHVAYGLFTGDAE
jgi:malonyl-CoA O-methyltransferase